MFLIQLLIGHKLTCATQSKYFGPFNYTFWSSLAKNKLILEIIGVKAVLLKKGKLLTGYWIILFLNYRKHLSAFYFKKCIGKYCTVICQSVSIV